VQPANLLPVPDIGVDRTAVLFALAVTIVTGVACVVPAVRASRVDPMIALRLD